jgi:hypothetical protein
MKELLLLAIELTDVKSGELLCVQFYPICDRLNHHYTNLPAPR